MSVRFDSAADMLATSTVPTVTSGVSMGGFFKLKVDTNAETCLFSIESSIGTGYLAVATDSTGTALWLIANGTLGFNASSTIALTVGVQYFIALTHDATTAKLYVFNVDVPGAPTTVTMTQGLEPSIDRISVGGNFYSWNLDGIVSHFRVWENLALTDPEAAAEASHLNAQKTTGLWGAWAMTTNSSGDRTTDTTGNGHTLVNPSGTGTWATEEEPYFGYKMIAESGAVIITGTDVVWVRSQGPPTGLSYAIVVEQNYELLLEDSSAFLVENPANTGFVALEDLDLLLLELGDKIIKEAGAPSGTTVTGTATANLGAMTGAASAGHGPSATVASTFSNMTGAASGSSVVASSASTLGAMTGSAAGSSVTSTAAATLGNATGSSSGAVGNAGTASATLGNMTGSAAGSTVVGTSSSSLAAMTGAAAAATGPTATAAATLGNMSSAVAGSTVVGSSASTLAAMTGAASAAHGVSGTAAATLANMAGAATGAFGAQFIGTGAATLADMTGSSAGAHGVSATASASLGSMTGAASGSSVKATSSSTLANMAGAASGTFTGAVTGTAAATLGAMTGAAAGSSTRATGAATLDTMAGSSTGAAGGALGAAAATLGTMTGAAVGQSGTVTGTVASQLEAMAGAAAGYVGVRPSELDVEISIARAGLEIFVPEPQLQVLQIDGSTLPVIFVSGALQPSGPTITLVRVEPVNLGARVRISATFTDPFTGALTDPTTPQLRVKAEGGSEVTYLSPDIIRDSVGKFHYDYLTTAVGVTAFMWGSLATDEESYSERGQFMVRPRAL